jgi:hypothetical protein
MQSAQAGINRGEAEAKSYWLVKIESDREYGSVFGDLPHLQIHSNRLPLPSPLSAEAIDALRSQGVPEQAIKTGALDIDALVRAGWNVSSVLPSPSDDPSGGPD